MRVNVITGKFYLIEKDEWGKIRSRSIVLMKEDWEIVKKALYGPCAMYKCKKSLDLISKAFEKLDAAVGAANVIAQ